MTQEAQKGTWTLTAPDGRTWQADSPIKAAKAELDDRVPASVQVTNILSALSAPESVKPVVWRVRLKDGDVWSYFSLERLADSYGDQYVKEPLYANPPSLAEEMRDGQTDQQIAAHAVKGLPARKE